MEKKFAIMRIEKKNMISLGRAYNHNYRTTKSAAPRAIEELRGLNEELIGERYGIPKKTYAEIYADKISKSEYYKTHKVRKNAVPALEILLTFSKEQIDKIDIEKWKRENVRWLDEKFGKENVISAVVHQDESELDDVNGTGIHIHAIVLPFDERGCLNARDIIGGPVGISRLQTEYAKAMSQFGLVRGELDKNDRHLSPAHYHKRLDEQLERERAYIPVPKRTETAIEYERRLEEPLRRIARDHTDDILQLEREQLRIRRAEAKMKNDAARKKSLDDALREIEEAKKDKKIEKDLAALMKRIGLDCLNKGEQPTREQMHEVKRTIGTLMELPYALSSEPDRDRVKRFNDEIKYFMRGYKEREKEREEFENGDELADRILS